MNEKLPTEDVLIVALVVRWTVQAVEMAAVLSGELRWCVIEADCLAVLPWLPDGCVDLVHADPPYAVSNEGLWHYGRPGKGKRRFDFFDGDTDWAGMIGVVCRAATATRRLMSPGGSAYWWCGHREFGPLVRGYERQGWKTRFLAWVKPNPSPPPPGSGWPSALELCVYAFREGRTWTYKGSNPPPSNAIVADSLRHGQPDKNGHPTQKPLETALPLLAASTLPGGVVLDCFAGSGTTGVAALRLGRRAILIERDAKYAAIARQRMEAEERGQSLKEYRAGQRTLWEA